MIKTTPESLDVTDYATKLITSALTTKRLESERLKNLQAHRDQTAFALGFEILLSTRNEAALAQVLDTLFSASAAKPIR